MNVTSQKSRRTDQNIAARRERVYRQNKVDSTLPGSIDREHRGGLEAHNWVINTEILWHRRRTLAMVAWISLVLGLLVAFLLPKRYESSARIIPPANSTGSAAMLAALTARAGGSLGAIGALTGGLLGGSGNTALFIDLLRSGTVTGHLIDRFDLQRVYSKRYRVDTAKQLARRTVIVDDKRSGVITLTVSDADPIRARDIAQAYLDELNLLVNRTNTSSAHQERLFIETRLHGVKADLTRAQQRLSEFSSTHSTIDIKEQTRAMVDAASRLQSQLIVEQSSLDALRQTYGDGNIRVRSSLARISYLRSQITKMSGSSDALPSEASSGSEKSTLSSDSNELYPPLRQLPRLAVPYADLYREVRVQETVYELLTQQYELARIQEAKELPVVSVIDAPGIPEKKSFPPRLLLALGICVVSVICSAVLLLLQRHWLFVPEQDPFKTLMQQITARLSYRVSSVLFWRTKYRSPA